MELASVVGALILAAWLVAISIADLRAHRIPNVLSLPLLAAGLIFSHLYSYLPIADHLIGASLGYLALAAFGEVFFRWRGREGLGLGDAKLLGAAGAWTGWAALPFILLVASCSGLLYALASRRRRSSQPQIAFGPHLAAGFWLVWLFGAPGLSPLWR